MSSLGRLAYTIRAKYGHGLRTAYYRDIVRPRVLNTPPIAGTVSETCEIHVLTCAADWLNLIWTLKSFYYYSQRRFSLCIHEDGTLHDEACTQLRAHFPNARLILRKDADAAVLPELNRYPLSSQLRQTNTLSLKVFDFRHYLHSERMLLLDSDILFFSAPKELLRRIEDPEYLRNTVNEDVASSYTAKPETVEERFGFELHPRFNSGLGLIHRESLVLDWIEQFLSLPDITHHAWRIEQTLFALCSSKYGVELLPEEYRVRLGGNADGLPCRHYVGGIRQLMYSEAVRKLVQADFLSQEASSYQ